MRIGENIRAARQNAGMTQKELGEKAGIAEPTIRRYELGKLNPKLETVKKIAVALGVEWTALYPTVDDSIGSKIKAQRLLAEMERAEVAQKIGIDEAVYAAWEDDEKISSIGERRLISHALGCPIYDLMTDTEKEAENRGAKLTNAYRKQDGYTYEPLETLMVRAFNDLRPEPQLIAYKFTQMLANDEKYRKESARAETLLSTDTT